MIYLCENTSSEALKLLLSPTCAAAASYALFKVFPEEIKQNYTYEAVFAAAVSFGFLYGQFDHLFYNILPGCSEHTSDDLG